MQNKNKNIVPFSSQAPSLLYSGGDPAVIAAAETAKARIQSAYIMAIQKPRDADQARQKILRMCDDPEFAEKVEYSKPVGKKAIKDLSIRFAEAAMAEWGNILSEVQMIFDDDNIRRIRISVIDLETNTQFSRDVTLKRTVERRSKKDREDDYISERKNTYGQIVYLLRATEDEMMIKESAMASKFIRTEGLRLLPAGIKQEAKEKSRMTLAHRDKADPDAAKKRILDAFAGLNLWPNDIKKYLGHSTDTLSPAEIAHLRTIYAAIDAGEASWTEYIQKKEEEGGKVNLKGYDKGGKEKQTIPPEGSPEAGEKVITTLPAFASLVKVEANKDYSYMATEDGVAHDNLSAYLEMVAGNNDSSPKEVMEQIIASDSFAGFWSGFLQGNWKKHFEGKLPAKASSEEKKEEPEAPSENANAFDSVDWKSNHLKAKGIENYWKTNQIDFGNASETSQQAFRDKWTRVFGEAKPFPLSEEKETKADATEPTNIPVAEENQEPLETTEGENIEPINYAEKLHEYHKTEPEKLLEACKKIGYSDIAIPMGKSSQKALYEMFQKVSEKE